LLRNDGTHDYLTLNTIHFKDNDGDDWSSDLNILENSAPSYFPGYTWIYLAKGEGDWAALENDTISIPPSIGIDTSTTVISDNCSSDQRIDQQGRVFATQLVAAELEGDFIDAIYTGGSHYFAEGICNVP
jgi:hypothetical protein